MERHRFDFSFSGLKTAVSRWVAAREASGEPVPVADVAASFQEAVADVLTRKAVLACREHGVGHLQIGGGVAANSRLRAMAQERCDAAGIELRVPRPGLCTDNGAMVAALGRPDGAQGPGPSDLVAAGRLLDAGHPRPGLTRAERTAPRAGRCAVSRGGGAGQQAHPLLEGEHALDRGVDLRGEPGSCGASGRERLEHLVGVGRRAGEHDVAPGGDVPHRPVADRDDVRAPRR